MSQGKGWGIEGLYTLYSKLLDLENPLFGATTMALSLILAEF